MWSRSLDLRQVSHGHWSCETGASGASLAGGAVAPSSVGPSGAGRDRASGERGGAGGRLGLGPAGSERRAGRGAYGGPTGCRVARGPSPAATMRRARLLSHEGERLGVPAATGAAPISSSETGGHRRALTNGSGAPSSGAARGLSGVRGPRSGFSAIGGVREDRRAPAQVGDPSARFTRET